MKGKIMNQEQLDKIITDHADWLAGNGGSRANLYNANLYNANLEYANLYNANLKSANLEYANLKSANLFTGIKTSYMIQLSGLRYYVWCMENHIKIGCKLYRRDEWQNFTDEEILQMDGKDGLRFWRAYKSIILDLKKNEE